MLLPEFNRSDLEEIPSAGLAGIRFEFLKTAHEALRLALKVEAPGDFSRGQLLAEPVIPNKASMEAHSI